MKKFKDILEKKLKTGNYSIGLGNFAYTPINEKLNEWLGSDTKAIETSFDKLLEDYADFWFKEQLNECFENGDIDLILFKSNPTQEEWEEHFIKVITK